MNMLRVPVVNGKMGFTSPTSFYNAVRAGLLTKPVKIGERAVGLPDFEVEEILKYRVAGKSDADIIALVNRLHAKRAELVVA